MRRRTPSATLTYPLFPSTSRFRSSLHRLGEAGDQLAARLFRAHDSGAADGFDRPAAGERGEPGGAGAGQLCIVGDAHLALQDVGRSDEHTSELQSLMRISNALFCSTQNKAQLTLPITH